MVQVKSKILYKQKITDKHFHLVIEGVSLIKDSCPGKFLEIKINDTNDPLLRRPFGIHRIQGNKLGILFEVVGKGTQILANKKAGEYLDIIGPLGNGFEYRKTKDERRKTILVAGGMGVAPLLFLAEKLAHSPQSMAHRKIMILLGAKTKEYILCEKEFRTLGCELKIATDDGSKGFKGKVTDLLKQFLTTHNSQLTTIYSCGPKLMLRELSVISGKHNIPAQLSLESHMACGIGACLGCVVNTTQGFKRVCKEGPVFCADEIVW
ncbi:MAG: dihydroorotate dehydrogenase electron transfer subunit [Candidatus Omnitrophota bacterium]